MIFFFSGAACELVFDIFEDQNSLVTNIIQNIFYVPQKTESHTDLKQHEGE